MPSLVRSGGKGPVLTPTRADRFSSTGENFRAKLIGCQPVVEVKGDHVCHRAMNELKTKWQSSGQHKQKIVINISKNGIKVIDTATQRVDANHAVHRISFISRDPNDERAFGYIYNPEPEGSAPEQHLFYGIKTANASEALVQAIYELFQIMVHQGLPKDEKKTVDANGNVEENGKVETDSGIVTSNGDKEEKKTEETVSEPAKEETISEAPKLDSALLLDLLTDPVELAPPAKGNKVDGFDDEFDKLRVSTTTAPETVWTTFAETNEQKSKANPFNDNFFNEDVKYDIIRVATAIPTTVFDNPGRASPMFPPPQPVVSSMYPPVQPVSGYPVSPIATNPTMFPPMNQGMVGASTGYQQSMGAVFSPHVGQFQAPPTSPSNPFATSVSPSTPAPNPFNTSLLQPVQVISPGGPIKPALTPEKANVGIFTELDPLGGRSGNVERNKFFVEEQKKQPTLAELVQKNSQPNLSQSAGEQKTEPIYASIEKKKVLSTDDLLN